MMKYILLCASLIFFAACKSGAGKTEASDSANATTAIQNIGGTAVDSAQNISGSYLIASSAIRLIKKVLALHTGKLQTVMKITRVILKILLIKSGMAEKVYGEIMR